MKQCCFRWKSRSKTAKRRASPSPQANEARVDDGQTRIATTSYGASLVASLNSFYTCESSFRSLQSTGRCSWVCQLNPTLAATPELHATLPLDHDRQKLLTPQSDSDPKGDVSANKSTSTGPADDDCSSSVDGGTAPTRTPSCYLGSVSPECSCSHECQGTHVKTSPLVSGDVGVMGGSYEETLTLARALEGHWVTQLSRSDSLDPHYRHLGIGMVKRSIMNRLAVPLTLFLENEDQTLHCHVHTPLGIRHMVSDLTGKEFTDTDPDCGSWTGVLRVVDFSIPWFSDGEPVRALQQTRHNATKGQAVETRCVLPDEEFGRIMLFSYTIYPDPTNKANFIHADRILKYVQ